jgi:hypothetical protein
MKLHKKKIKPTMKNNKSKEKQKSKTNTIYLSVASVPLDWTEAFEIQDYSNAPIAAHCILKQIDGIRQLNRFHICTWLGILNAGL